MCYGFRAALTAETSAGRQGMAGGADPVGAAWLRSRMSPCGAVGAHPAGALGKAGGLHVWRCRCPLPVPGAAHLPRFACKQPFL